MLRTQTSLPLPHQVTLDTSLALLSYPYLLLSTSVNFGAVSASDTTRTLSLSEARKSNLLSPRENILIDLQLGANLRQLHNIQNDWFGFPKPTPPVSSPSPNIWQDLDPSSYSWQESFTPILEYLLQAVESAHLPLPYEDIRRYLSRAIGSFLFDDVEVPSLIWFTGSEDDVLVSIPSALPSLVASSSTPAVTDTVPVSTPTIELILPNFAHALWADPLLESLFNPPGPSAALLEGYLDSGGGPLIVFPRQRTKRLWYTLFLALVILVEHEEEKEDGTWTWALNVLADCVKALKDAPCY